MLRERPSARNQIFLNYRASSCLKLSFLLNFFCLLFNGLTRIFSIPPLNTTYLKNDGFNFNSTNSRANWVRNDSSPIRSSPVSLYSSCWRQTVNSKLCQTRRLCEPIRSVARASEQSRLEYKVYARHVSPKNAKRAVLCSNAALFSLDCLVTALEGDHAREPRHLLGPSYSCLFNHVHQGSDGRHAQS